MKPIARLVPIVSLLIAYGLAATPTASAQVAAPSLNPVALGLPATGNPGVLPWDGPSRVAAIVGTAEFTIPTAPVDPVAEGDVAAVAALAVGETFAASIVAAELSVEQDALFGGGQQDFSLQALQAGAKVGGLVAGGLSWSEQTQEGAFDNETATLPTAGLSLRLGERFFLGAAAGTETLSDDVLNVETERDVLTYGAGVFWRDGADGFHLEAYAESRDGIVGTLGRDEEEALGVTAEVLFGGLLLGVSTAETERTDALGVLNETVADTAAYIGWAPGQGLALTALVSEEVTEDGAGVETQAFSLATVGVAWMF